MPNFVQLYKSTDLNAPVLTGQVGTLINLLNRVLVDGYTTASISSITRSGSTATVTLAVANSSILTGDYFTIAGATPSYYNGTFQITAINSTSFSYELPFLAYSLEVLDDDPVLYYRMAATSGTAEPSIGSVNTAGTYSGTYTLNSGAIVDQGASVRFSGTSGSGGRLDSGHNTNYTSAATLECWIKPQASGHGSAPRILSKITFHAQYQYDFPIYIGFNPGTFTVHLGLSDGTNFIVTALLESGVLTADTVYHVVGVYRAAGLCELYVNGVQVASTTIAFTIPTNTRNWTVGAATPHVQPQTDSTFNGDISEAALYNTALSSARILRHFTSGNLQATTGTLLYNKTPLGWTKPFVNGTNSQTYRSADNTSNQFYLQVIDNGGQAGGAREAQVYGAEVMSADQTVTTGRFPTTVQYANGMCWKKSDALDSNARPWTIIGDDRTFYLQIQPTNAVGASTQLYGFGFFYSLKVGDVYNTFLAAGSAFNTTNTLGGLIAAQPPTSLGTSTAGLYIARPHTQVLGAVNGSVCGFGGTTIGGNSCISYPNGPDNGFYVNPVFVGEPTSGGSLRGRFPGFYNPLHGTALVNYDQITGVIGLPGIVLTAISGSSSTVGQGMFDTFGPWN